MSARHLGQSLGLSHETMRQDSSNSPRSSGNRLAQAPHRAVGGGWGGGGGGGRGRGRGRGSSSDSEKKSGFLSAQQQESLQGVHGVGRGGHGSGWWSGAALAGGSALSAGRGDRGALDSWQPLLAASRGGAVDSCPPDRTGAALGAQSRGGNKEGEWANSGSGSGGSLKSSASAASATCAHPYPHPMGRGAGWQVRRGAAGGGGAAAAGGASASPPSRPGSAAAARGWSALSSPVGNTSSVSRGLDDKSATRGRVPSAFDDKKSTTLDDACMRLMRGNSREAPLHGGNTHALGGLESSPGLAALGRGLSGGLGGLDDMSHLELPDALGHRGMAHVDGGDGFLGGSSLSHGFLPGSSLSPALSPHLMPGLHVSPHLMPAGDLMGGSSGGRGDTPMDDDAPVDLGLSAIMPTPLSTRHSLHQSPAPDFLKGGDW
jgi:hypothetical protein